MPPVTLPHEVDFSDSESDHHGHKDDVEPDEKFDVECRTCHFLLGLCFLITL